MVRVFSFFLRNFLILNLSPILLSIEWFTLPLPPEHWVLHLNWKEEDVSADQERQRAKEGMERGGERAGWAVGWKRVGNTQSVESYDWEIMGLIVFSSLRIIMIAFMKCLLGSLLCTCISVFNPYHLPHFANEEGKAKRHGARGPRANKRWGQDSNSILSPQSRLITALVYCHFFALSIFPGSHCWLVTLSARRHCEFPSGWKRQFTTS